MAEGLEVGVIEVGYDSIEGGQYFRDVMLKSLC